MDTSEAPLDGIELQSSPDAFHNSSRTISSRAFLGGRREDTESVPEFLINVKFSDLFDVPSEYVLMTVEMLSKLNDENEEWLEKLRRYGIPLACLENDGGDSLLHLAAKWNHLQLVKKIIAECPCLLLKPNSKGQLPIHLAAHIGHEDVVEVFVESVRYFSSISDEENRAVQNPYIMQDINGDTALNLAFKGNNILGCLMDANKDAWFIASKDGLSPIYLAVVRRLSAVGIVLENNFHGERNLNLECKYLAHTALKSMSPAMIDIILDKCPSLMDERNEEGRTCLSFGASIGFYDAVCKLLNRSTKGVFIRDDDESYPIHVAVEKGHMNIVKEILKRCPYSKYLLNKKGQNILHIAAEIGRFKILSHLMKCKDTSQHLAVEKDVDGNTPLHLATMKWRPRAVRCLAGSKNLFTQNKSGMTALDIAESTLQPHYIFRERLTMQALVCAHWKNDPRCNKEKMSYRRPIRYASGGNKDYVNALLVVAALIATVTFTAGFTLPGGVKSSAPYFGMANLANNHRLVSFMVIDIVALQSSLVAIVSLILAQSGDPALYGSYLKLAMSSMFIAIYSMNFAFLYAMYIAAGSVSWLRVIVFVFILPASLMMLSVFVPHLHLHGGWALPSKLVWGIAYSGLFFDEDGSHSQEFSDLQSGKISNNDDNVKSSDE